MPRNSSRLVLLLGAAFLVVAPALHAQQTGAPVRGDVDGDGQVTAADARIVSDFLVGRAVPPGANVRERGDVNGDGRVTSVDAAIIAAAAAGRDVSRFPVGKAVTGAVATLECTADVRARSVSCGAPGSQGGARGNVIVGGQNLNVKLTSSNLAINPADSTFKFDVTVQNLLHQAMAADSGTGAASATGVRVFFHQAPTMTEPNPSGSGSNVAVLNADGMNTFTGTNQRYYQYAGTDLGADGILSPGETSTARNWQFRFDSGVNKFTFLLYVSTAMKHPKGWVDIYPPNNHYSSPDSVFADTVVAGRTLQLQDSVRNPFGGHIPGAPVSWSNTSHGFATVNATGLVSTPVGVSGVDSVTATSGPRSGTVTIVVTPPTGANSVISASPLSVSAGDTSVVTVQVKDGFGNNVTTGGDAVSLTTSLGTLVATAAGTGTTVTPDDNGNGTYTAKLTSTTTGTANLSGTVLGGAIGTTASVTFTPAAPANISVTSTNPQNGTVGAAVASVPTVHVTDQFGNAVGAGIPVVFAVTGGGGSLTSASTTTDASGNASVGSWTLGSTLPGPNALSATVTGGSNPSTTFTAFVPAFVVSDSSQAMGNSTVPSSVTPNVLTNDFTMNGAGGVSLKPASVGNLVTARGGTVSLAVDGTFSYLPPAGSSVARDSVQYEIQDTHYTGPVAATNYIKFRFVGKVWYVDNTFGGTADGRDVSPFTSVGAAATAAAVNDSILVRTGSGTTTGGTLKNGQLVYGQGASSSFTTTLNGNSVTLLAAGSAPSIGALTLGSGNTLRGFIGAGTITGSGFGTLTVSEVGLNTGATQALSLTTGTLSGGFTSLVSSGGTNNVLLSGVSTSGTSTLGASGNALSGATGDGVVISGGAGSFTFPGNVSNGNSFAVNVNGKTGGTVTFSGNINPGGAARGISLSGNSSGSNTIVFSGGTKAISSSTAAGVFVNNNTGASISFTGGGLTIATTTGTPFTATGGGTVEVSGSGNTISASGAAANAVLLNGITLGAGGMSFASVSSTGTTTGSAFSATGVGNTSGSSFSTPSLTVAGTNAGAANRGLAISSSSAPFTFTTASINGTGGEGIYLVNNTGAVAVNGGSVGNTSNTTGDALFVSGGNADVTVAASLAKTSAGRIANIGSHTAGNVTVSGSLSCTASCTGIRVDSNSGGTIAFTNATQTLTTAANAAVTLSSNTGATVNFTGGNLTISTTSGAGLTATGGGTVTVTGANNTISSTALVSGGGNALNVQNTSIGASNLVFKSINASGSAYGIRLENTGASGGLQVTGTGSTANSGGTITKNGVSAGGDSSAITLTGTANLSLKLMRVSITVGGASGITAKNLSGTSLLERSVVDFNNATAAATYNAYGFIAANSSTNGTITLDGVTFQNGTDGEAAASFSNMGTSVVTINVQDSNTGDAFESMFTNLFGSGMTVGAGDDAGSTANVHLNVSNTKFTNAPSNGINDLEMTVQQSASLVPNISNNTFDKVGLPLATVGVINVNTTGSGRLGAAGEFGQISNNTISNIRSGAGPTFAYDPAGTNGYVGIRVAIDGNAGVNHKLKILNNNITSLARQGIIVSARGSVNDVNVSIEGNTVGTAAAPVGASNRRGVEVETQSAASLKVLIQNNPSIVGAGSSGSNSSLAIRAGVTNSSTGTLNATVVGNTIGSTNAGTTGRFRGETAAGTTGSSPTMCLDLRNNVLESASKVFELTNNVGTYNRNASGNTGTVTLTGTIGSVASCTQPSF